ncbi:uncharacterized protein KD926_004314 [Aspergillus affinis]|uniref:uncharacterized protein n=1 Tax=Aspergillus affinis TaxID=1070780 RepID=UPI0022FE502C|nr:uncharacterized protein KD926_004314 [Aspergillus affinis]KAI9043131.1 hypothetical protein KD926_004314 [Aspergillus affinis]
MESERGYDNPTTFNNTDAVSFQALHQTINTDSIVLNNGQTRAYMNIDEEVLGSLAFPEMHQRQSNIEKPHMHTCSWILKLKEYNDWMNASNGLLWIKGKPGSGKSTIMAFLYQQIMKPHTAEKGIALEFFFSARGSELQRTPLGLFRTLLNQLYRQDFNLCTVLREVYQDKCDSFGRSKHGWEWQLPELERVFYDNIAISAQRQPLIIFVDALDEAGQESARYLAKFFHHVNDLIKKRPASGKICIACRHYPGITSTCGIEIVVEDHNHDDITTYVRDSLPLGFPLSPGTPSYQSWDSVVNDLIKSAHGVFLWIRLVVPLVEKRVQDGESPENIQRFLRKVPQKLGDVYEDILRNTIEQEYRSQASLLFQWVCLAERPLSVTEMRYAMSARDISMSPSRVRCNETSTFVTSDELMKLRIRAWSGGLIEAIIDQKSTTETVQVIHQSVNDFIVDKGLVVLSGLHDGEQKRCQLEGRQWNSTFMMKHSQGVIYRSCLNYLATEDVQVTSDDNKERLLQRWPFLNYATIQIFMHARKAVEHRFGNVEKEVFLLQHVIQKWIASYSLMDGFSPMCPVPITTLLHIGSASNMTDIIKDLVCRKIYLNEEDSIGSTALHYAANYGSTEAAEILLRSGADINLKNQRSVTPLVSAAGHGQKALVELLLREGSNVNESTGYSGNALQQAASSKGSKEVVQVLLNAGADINAQGGQFGNALQGASYQGSKEVVQVLLNAGADVNAQGGKYGNALQAASFRGSKDVVQLLLNAGADVNAQGGEYGNALQAASFRGSKDVVQLLLNAGANVNAQGGHFGNALQGASSEGTKEVVQLLLSAGANVNAQGGIYGNALQAASSEGTKEVVRMLLDAGANVNAQGGIYGNALQAASFRGSKDVVQVLLNAGADVNAQGGQYGNALIAAIFRQRRNVIALLLANGINPSLPSQNGQTAAHIAARAGSSAIIDIIKINPACLHTKDLFDRTPIHLAIYSGHLKHIPLWSTGDHDHPIMDHYGKTLQDWATRDQAMSIELQKYLPVLPPTPNHIQIKVLSQSVRTLTKKLLYTNRWASPGLFELGRCLMLLEKFDDARFVLSQQAAQLASEISIYLQSMS